MAQEYYELRTYVVTDFDKQNKVETYIKDALMPALQRMGIDRIGVFNKQDDVNDHQVYMLIPFKDINTFTSMNETLAADKQYNEDAAFYHQQDPKDPFFARIISRFMKAFKSMPVIEMPPQTAEGKERLFELRLYENPNEDQARLKVEMFDEGETQLMRDSKMGPVFFGSTLIGPQVPNLIYMLSAENMDGNKAGWQNFLKSQEWDRMKKIEKYKDAVSKIEKTYLKPTAFSQI